MVSWLKRIPLDKEQRNKLQKKNQFNNKEDNVTLKEKKERSKLMRTSQLKNNQTEQCVYNCRVTYDAIGFISVSFVQIYRKRG